MKRRIGMKTYENLKRSYGKYLNMDFYVYEPDLEKIKGKNKHEIVYEPIINANKDCGFVESVNGHYYVSDSDIDKLVIPDDIYSNLIMKALAYNLSHYGVQHFDEIYATAAEDDRKGTVRQLRDSAGKLLLQYCDNRNILINFTEDDYKSIGNYIGRFCTFSNMYVDKTVFTMERLILNAKSMLNGKLRTWEPFITKTQHKNSGGPICIVNDIFIIKNNMDCVALKKNEQHYYISLRSLNELIIPKKDYYKMCLRMIVSNIDLIGLKKLPDAKTDILNYVSTNHFNTLELLSSHWLIDSCRQDGMFSGQKEEYLNLLTKILAENGEFPKKCAKLISLPSITKKIQENGPSHTARSSNKINEFTNQFSKETEVKSFQDLANQCRDIIRWKDPIVYAPLLAEARKFFRKTDAYTIKDERIIKANRTLDKVFQNGNKYQIKKDDIKWLIIPDSIHDDLLLELLIENIDRFGSKLYERDRDWIFESVCYLTASLDDFVEWLLNTLRNQGLIDDIPTSLYQKLYEGLKKGYFATQCMDFCYSKNAKDIKEEREEERRLLEEEKDREDWW